MDDVTGRSATELARAIRDGEITSVEVAEAHVSRIEAINPLLNALVDYSAEEFLAQARAADRALARGERPGPLHGVPVSVKDALDVKGFKTTAGTPGLAGNVAAVDAHAVRALRSAGAIVIGKTNTPEFSFAFECDNLLHGRTNNPYDLDRSPGASSGGEAALVSACGSPLGLGSDAGGSLRVPAHYCGLAAIKPTTRRVPRTGHFPPALGLLEQALSIGALARSVDDIDLVLSLLARPDGADPGVPPLALPDSRGVRIKGLRVAFYGDDRIIPSDAATYATVRAAASALASCGAAVEEARPECVRETADLYLGILGADGGEALGGLPALVGSPEASPGLLAFVERLRPRAVSSAGFAGILTRLDLFRLAMMSFMTRFDVVVSPVSASPATIHGATADDTAFLGWSYSWTYGLAGWPAATVRCGTTPDGLPIGVQVAAVPWNEHVVLAAARSLEAALGGWQAPPLAASAAPETSAVKAQEIGRQTGGG